MVSVSLETEHMLDQLDLHLAPSSDSTVIYTYAEHTRRDILSYDDPCKVRHVSYGGE